MNRPDHIAKGDPICSCGIPSADHRLPRFRIPPSFFATGRALRLAASSLSSSPSSTPRSAQRSSRVDTRKRTWTRFRQDKRKRTRQREYVQRHSANDEPIVAIDGEGQGRQPHLYTYLAAVDEYGTLRGEIADKTGLTTQACLDFFLDLGVKRVFGFSIGYDLTKILTGLPDTKLYRLNRPELRKFKLKGREAQKPVYWRDYKLGYMRGRLTIQRTRFNSAEKKYIDYGPSVVLWDIFRFYQSKFTSALLDWNIAPKEKLARMIRMKDLRAEFDKLTAKEINEYCQEECHYLALLVRKLIEAHDNVDLSLTAFYGAGSTASAMLTKYGVKEFIAPHLPAMKHAVSCGFFGGRFEISRSGPIQGPVYNYDISSAYPYQMTGLPCLACGRWQLVRGKTLRRRVEEGALALIHASVKVTSSAPDAWGPFPFRTEKGTILFPKSLGGCWVWKEEFFTAEELFPGVKMEEAWVYDTSCDHKPFSFLPPVYCERLRIGKEGPGIVLKLGMNSGYGKTAQSLGSAPFQSFIWAGVITSNTRAQLLKAFCSAKNWWSVLMFATDGVFSTEKLVFPKPRDTGTDIQIDRCNGKIDKSKPLGGWEEKIYERGVFLLRPGIYFPLNPTEDELKDVKARGMSKGVLLENAPKILEHWEKTKGEEPFKVEGLQRFVGMMTGIHKSSAETKTKRMTVKRSEDYGEWIDYPIVASFSSLPKRERVLPGYRLSMFDRMVGESSPYKKVVRSEEAKALQEAEMVLGEQADGDFAQYSEGTYLEDFR